MRIDSISSGLGNLPSVQPTQQSPQSGDTNFADSIKNALGKVNDLQTTADQAATKMASGDPMEVHQAMIAMQQASTALQFAVQVRNRVIEAYQEVMKTQV